ncbi:MAG TPA: fumarylacetoacetate hydrolase family protein [Usitatibacter sp.]
MTLGRESLAAIARELRAAQDEVRVVAPFTSRIPGFDIPAAYEVADLLHRENIRAGAHPVGRKLGFTNPGMWATYGVTQPIWAYMYDTTVHDLRDGTPWSLAKFVDPKIEPEIILHFCKPPSSTDPAAILECIDWIAHGFEIVQSRYPGWKFAGADAVAAASLHGMLLVGERHSVESLGPGITRDLAAFNISLLRDGAPVAAGKGTDVLGSPLLAVAHLVAVLKDQPQYVPIQAGEMVTTGTITMAQSMRAGERWSTALEGIGLAGIHASFD